MSCPQIPPGAICLPPAKARAKFGKGNTWLWEKVKSDPYFPKPVYLGPRSPVFIEQHLDEYIARCAAGAAGAAVAA